jgi:hypothetical protein
MFLHHTMTDSEILRSCEGCTSQHLRLVADRLRIRVDGMREISALANAAIVSHDLNEIRDTLREIIDTSDNNGN